VSRTLALGLLPWLPAWPAAASAALAACKARCPSKGHRQPGIDQARCLPACRGPDLMLEMTKVANEFRFLQNTGEWAAG